MTGRKLRGRPAKEESILRRAALQHAQRKLVVSLDRRSTKAQEYVEWVMAHAEGEARRRGMSPAEPVTLEWLALREALTAQDDSGRWAAASEYLRLQRLEEARLTPAKNAKKKRPKWDSTVSEAIERELRSDILMSRRDVQEAVRKSTKRSNITISNAMVTRVRNQLKDETSAGAVKVRYAQEEAQEAAQKERYPLGCYDRVVVHEWDEDKKTWKAVAHIKDPNPSAD